MEFLGSLLRSMSFRDENSGASRNVSCVLRLFERSLFDRANQGTVDSVWFIYWMLCYWWKRGTANENRSLIQWGLRGPICKK